jgi:hypothetical protein
LELLLNLVWLVIALAAVAAFASLAWRKSRAPQEGRRAWVALGCVLVLLFFAISMSDDLHQNAILLDDGRSPKQHATFGAPGHGPRSAVDRVHPSAAVLAPSPVRPFSLVDFAAVRVESAPSALGGARILPCGRAPPLASL